jgi:hypothetical protein
MCVSSLSLPRLKAEKGAVCVRDEARARALLGVDTRLPSPWVSLTITIMYIRVRRLGWKETVVLSDIPSFLQLGRET